jgi:hypothetical protein
VTRYPLTWPRGWPRETFRRGAHFGQRSEGATGYVRKRELSVSQAVDRLFPELNRLGARSVILSTNVPTRLDGTPRSDTREPADPGVAVYFELKKKATVLACDRWNRTADNIAAIAAHVEALRAIGRYGVGSVEQAFAGYTALPERATSDWRAILKFEEGVRVTMAEVDERFRELARTAHPDAGGTHDMMAAYTRARADAKKELEG